ncbi:ATP-grasp domain-containing protein [Flavobacteriaceae bacterium XHP0103]|uniref:ATP-grasp domain-containing protein n=1 Tax=Marixanthotalea marina TaxID=2844359 RepID=UPI002989F39C|nr:ATP-grasp domain-containing protein [Marixanthotalea marina]MBU3821437.1 ATP-grasp domain-containing protein [Marixanthotalea marina]
MKFSILIPDAEKNYVFAVINCLSQVSRVDIYLMSNEEHHSIKYSKHIKNHSYYPKTNDETVWLSNINNELKKYDINLVMPIFEDGIGTIIKYKDSILFKDKLCLMPSYQNFNTALNKKLLYQHMVKNKISCCTGFVFDKYIFNNKEFRFPVLIKPVKGTEGGVGIHKFYKKKELEQFFAQNSDFSDAFLIEEFIEGFDLSCNVLCKDGEILLYTIQKGILFDDKPFSSPIGVKFLFDLRLLKEVEILIKSLEWSGIANIDIRYDSITDNFKIIEINPRFWGSLEASLAAGINFPYLYCLLSSGQKIEKQEYNFIEYLNFNALVKAIKNDKKLIFHIKFILNNTQLKFILNDPKLYLRKLYIRFKLFLRPK